MIKKILLTFLMVMMCGFANADQCFKLSPRAAASALSKDTEIQTKIVAAHSYEIKRNETSNKCHGGKINAESFWKLCSMAGIDIKTQNGKMQCYNKVADLIEHNGTYYRACGKDAAKLGAKAICVNVFKDIQVQVTQGIALAQEYVLKKFNLKGLKCNNERRPADNTDAMKYTNQDFVQCYLPATNTYFEFEFDDLKESSDDRVKTDFARGICIAFNKDEYGTIFIPGRAFCFNTSESECKNINAVSKLYGGNAKLDSESYRKSVNPLYKKDDVCLIGMYNVIYSRKDLKTAYGIDNFMFCKGGSLQFQNTGGLTESLKTYVAKAAKVSASSVRCDAATKVYWGDGCNADIGSGYSGSDDIISCYVGTNQIDFVFDDVNEFSSKYAQGAQQGMDCIVEGGTYNGKKCMHLGKEQCETLRQANLKNCPECTAVRWDGENCILPSSKTATNLKKGVDIAVIVGGAAVGIVLTAVAGPESGAPVLAWVLVGIETVGAGIEIGSQLKIDGIADEFFAQSGKCKDAKCAEDLLKKYFERLINVQGDMNEVEISAANEEIARLANIIPDDAKIWEQIGDNLTLEENAKGIYEGWEAEQIWRAVGIGLQFASLGTVGIKFLISKSSRLQKATTTVARKLKNAKILKNAKKAKAVETTGGLKDTEIAPSVKKIANADSAESEAGFEAMMQRVAESNERKITPEEIQAEYIRRQTESGGKYTSADIEERINNYKEYYENHGNGAFDTQAKYRAADGGYTAERQQIHDKILDDLFKDADKAKPAAGEKPTFVMLGGRGGSGKSSLKGLAYDPEKTVVIDADKIKTMLPEYSELFQQQSKYAGLNAWEVHEESSDIVKAALDMAKERGINVVLDGTMSSSGSALKKITPFKDAGYRIEGAYMYLPREESTVRGMGRSMNLDYSDVESGRFVPTDILLNMKDNEKAFGEVSEHFDSWGIWTTEGVQKGEVPNLIGHSEDIGVFERGPDFQKLNNTDIDLTTFGK